jgi:excisionase family DNA binding protein
MSDTPAPDATKPLELAAPAPQWVTIAEASALYGISDSTLRRAIRKGRLKAEQVKTERGPEWRFTMQAVEALGYSRKPAEVVPTVEAVSAAEVKASASALALEEAQRRIADLTTRLEVNTVRGEFLERENARLTADLEDTKANLRKALDRIPLALPPAKPSVWARMRGRKGPENGPNSPA